MMKLSRYLTEKELLDGLISATDRNFVSVVGGTEYLCRYLGQTEGKTLGYRIVSRSEAVVLCYEYAGNEPFDRAYAQIYKKYDRHPCLIHLHNS